MCRPSAQNDSWSQPALSNLRGGHSTEPSCSRTRASSRHAGSGCIGARARARAQPPRKNSCKFGTIPFWFSVVLKTEDIRYAALMTPLSWPKTEAAQILAPIHSQSSHHLGRLDDSASAIHKGPPKSQSKERWANMQLCRGFIFIIKGNDRESPAVALVEGQPGLRLGSLHGCAAWLL